ncbi:uncharacterized protein [Malus domestica]|uniref:uncharacterized protein n=1 Tax=Malus domestica TaxID=3750 RepID=UPI0039763286
MGFMLEKSTLMPQVAFTCWHIWKARCDVVFNHKPISLTHATQAISCALVVFEQALERNPESNLAGQRDSSQHTVWSPFDSECVKINVDASWNSSTQNGYVGIVIRDQNSMFVVARKSPIKAFKVVVAEALAVLERCMFAKQLGLNKVIVESDSKETILCLRKSIQNSS